MNLMEQVLQFLFWCICILTLVYIAFEVFDFWKRLTKRDDQ